MKFRKAAVWAGALGPTAIGVLLTSGGCSSSTSSSPDSGSDGSTTTTSSSSGGSTSGTTSSSSGSSTSSSSGSSGGDDGSVSDSPTSDGSSSGSDAASDGSSGGLADAPSEAGCSGSTPITLTVVNYKVWCSVSVSGMTSSTAKSQTVCVAAGSVDLEVTPGSSNFEIGSAPWHDTSGDRDGGGDPGTMAGDGATETDKTTVVVGAGATSACVWVCCPFAAGSGETPGSGCETPTPNPCP